MNTATSTHDSDHEVDVWQTAFSAAERDEQLREDSQAWRGVTGLLMAVVGGGALFGAIVVTLIALYG
jgi:hypothetical protein